MKRILYLILTTILGILLSFFIHAGIELIYLNWVVKNHIAIKWTYVIGGNACALPLWLIYLLPILGIIFGLWLGFYWWNKVYGNKNKKEIKIYNKMKKKTFFNLVILGIVIILTFLFLYQSQKFSPEITALNSKVNQTSSLELSSSRKQLLLEFDAFVKKEFPFNNPFFQILLSNVRKFFGLRIDQALAEIEKTKVKEGEIVLWYIYNMGVIAKANNLTVAFDLSGSWLNEKIPKLAEHIDVLILSHSHSDHLDPAVVKKAVQNNVSIIFPSGVAKIADVPKSNLLMAMEPNTTIEVKGVKITAYPAVHGGGPQATDEPTRWFLVQFPKTSFLHTDDADLKDENDFQKLANNVDVFLADFRLPREKDILKIKPKITLPLHRHELAHGKKGSLDNFEKVLPEVFKIKEKNPSLLIIPMIWGEKITI